MQIRFFNMTDKAVELISEITITLNETLSIREENAKMLLLLSDEFPMNKILNFFQDCHPKAQRIFAMEGMDVYYSHISILKDYIGYTIPGCTDYLLQKIIASSLDCITTRIDDGTASFQEVSDAIHLVNILQRVHWEGLDEDIISYWSQY